MKRPLTKIKNQGEIEGILVTYLRNIKPDAISETANVSQLKIYRILDSLGVLELITHLETTFAIQICDEDVLARNFETVGSLSAFVCRKLAERAEVTD